METIIVAIIGPAVTLTLTSLFSGDLSLRIRRYRRRWENYADAVRALWRSHDLDVSELPEEPEWRNK